MKVNKKKIIFMILGIIILIIIYIINDKIEYKFQDDIMFFKLFNNRNDDITINILKNKVQSTNINILMDSDSINYKEKIAPGSKGDLKIKIISNKNMKYKLEFKEISEKPQNLLFYNNSQKYNKLEEMNEVIGGDIEAYKSKYIIINWEWKYEIDDKSNIEDTLDGEKIKRYNFEIFAYGY